MNDRRLGWCYGTMHQCENLTSALAWAILRLQIHVFSELVFKCLKVGCGDFRNA